MSGFARTSRVVGRFAGRAVAASAMVRLTRRYPVIAVSLFVWRWWRRRRTRVEHTNLQLRRNDVITITDISSDRGI